MKNIVFLLLSVLVLASCDSMLDVTPKTDLTDVNFWLTEAHFKGASNALYNQLPTKDFDSRGDDLVTEYFTNENSQISAGSWSIPGTNASWTNPYRAIANANNIIENAPKSPVDEKIRNRYLGEALFFRAWWYFDLVCKYGDVPLVLKVFKETQDPDLKMGRTPRETVIQQCYEDLRQAASFLPTRSALESTTNELDRRRATRSAALGLMVRIGLHEGTMRKYHNLSNDWQAHLDVAISAFNELKAEGHQLYTGDGAYAYLGQFLEERNNVNKEIIFGKAHGPNGSVGSGYWNSNYSVSIQETWAATRWMIDMYLYADGLPGEKSAYYLPTANETSYNNVFGFEADGKTPNGHPRDPRLPLTFWREWDPDDNTSFTIAGLRVAWSVRRGERFNHYYNTTRHAPGYHFKKSHVGQFAATSNSDNNDNILIRWGEMLIAYAEALYERNGNITDAQLDETVNALRSRAGFSVKLTNAFVAANGLNMLEEIRRERTIELMCEGRRYTDIIRWKTAEKMLPRALIGHKYFAKEAIEPASAAMVLQACTNADGYNGGVFVYPSENIWVCQRASDRKFKPERDYFYPIPTNEIAKSEGNIVQNPNWKEE